MSEAVLRISICFCVLWAPVIQLSLFGIIPTKKHATVLFWFQLARQNFHTSVISVCFLLGQNLWTQFFCRIETCIFSPFLIVFILQPSPFPSLFPRYLKRSVLRGNYAFFSHILVQIGYIGSSTVLEACLSRGIQIAKGFLSSFICTPALLCKGGGGHDHP